MKYGQLLITKKDYELIHLILINWRQSKELIKSNYEKLCSELKNVLLKKEKDLPQDVVKFGSRVDIQTPWGLFKEYELVVPSQSNVQAKKISILTPIGSAIFGYAEGDEITWEFPNGEQVIKLIKVQNPVPL